jgi:hypothetical protein
MAVVRRRAKHAPAAERIYARIGLLRTQSDNLGEALMRYVFALLLVAGLLAPPAHGQTSGGPAPGTMALSPNNCGTPDTPKPCHTTKNMKAVHKASASYHK